MWTYHVHWHIAHGVVTETASCGWGWYMVLAVVVVVVVATTWVLRRYLSA